MGSEMCIRDSSSHCVSEWQGHISTSLELTAVEVREDIERAWPREQARQRVEMFKRWENKIGITGDLHAGESQCSVCDKIKSLTRALGSSLAPGSYTYHVACQQLDMIS